MPLNFHAIYLFLFLLIFILCLQSYLNSSLRSKVTSKQHLVSSSPASSVSPRISNDDNFNNIKSADLPKRLKRKEFIPYQHQHHRRYRDISSPQQFGGKVITTVNPQVSASARWKRYSVEEYYIATNRIIPALADLQNETDLAITTTAAEDETQRNRKRYCVLEPVVSPLPAAVKPRPLDVSDLISGKFRLQAKFADKKKKRLVRISVVILIYTYGFHSQRFNLTEKIFKHYRNIKYIFRDYAKFSFTVVGSEESVSRNLTLKYFPPEDYFEFSQKPLRRKHTYEIITHKISFGMRTAFARGSKGKTDIIVWVGSNDYVSLNFWRQVIEDFHPRTMKLYGIDNYHNGRNAVFFTNFDGQRVTDRSVKQPGVFFTSGQDTIMRSDFHYVGGALGITRSALVEYPHILDFWNCDEGLIEHYVLRNTSNSTSAPGKVIQKFSSSELFFMNIKMQNKRQDATSANYLQNLYKLCNYILNESSSLSSTFLRNFDREVKYFEENCSLY